jgi:hypothetical protein
MALRISVVIVAAISLVGLMFNSLSRQVETTDTQTTSAAFNGSRAILQDIVGVGGSQFPMLLVVAFIAGGLGTALILTR